MYFISWLPPAESMSSLPTCAHNLTCFIFVALFTLKVFWKQCILVSWTSLHFFNPLYKYKYNPYVSSYLYLRIVVAVLVEYGWTLRANMHSRPTAGDLKQRRPCRRAIAKVVFLVQSSRAEIEEIAISNMLILKRKRNKQEKKQKKY